MVIQDFGKERFDSFRRTEPNGGSSESPQTHCAVIVKGIVFKSSRASGQTVSRSLISKNEKQTKQQFPLLLFQLGYFFLCIVWRVWRARSQTNWQILTSFLWPHSIFNICIKIVFCVAFSLCVQSCFHQKHKIENPLLNSRHLSWTLQVFWGGHENKGTMKRGTFTFAGIVVPDLRKTLQAFLASQIVMPKRKIAIRNVKVQARWAKLRRASVNVPLVVYLGEQWLPARSQNQLF